MIVAHTKCVAKKGASIQSIAVFLKIWGNIFKKISSVGLSILQNGNIPQFFGEDGIQQIFFSDDPSTCYSRLQEAFKDLGIQLVGMLLKGSISVR